MHQIFTETNYKTALSACDDKVFLCDDNIHTVILDTIK